MSGRITNEQLKSIVLREHRKRKNKEINEGIIGDLLGSIGKFLQAMTKSVATNTKEATLKTLRATKDAFESSNLTKEGMKDMGGAYKKSLEIVAKSYQTSFDEVVNVLSQSPDKDIQKNLKGYASNVVMTCMADVASVVEGKSDINDLINALQSGNIDTKADADESANNQTGSTET